MPDYGAVLRQLIPFFEQEKIRVALGGGFALQALGRSRLTFDLDLIVDGAAQVRIVRHMEELGFETLRVTDGYSNHVRDKQRVDFIYLRGRTAELVLRDAQVRQTKDGALPVADPEYLAMMKFLAVKNNPERDRQDIPDFVSLLRLPGIDRQSRSEELPDFERDMPLTAEDIEYLRRLRDNPPRLTWDEYVRAVDELNEQWPPYRELPVWDEPFEI